MQVGVVEGEGRCLYEQRDGGFAIGALRGGGGLPEHCGGVALRGAAGVQTGHAALGSRASPFEPDLEHSGPPRRYADCSLAMREAAVTVPPCCSAAVTNPSNSGEGRSGRLLNSGWYCAAT